MILLETLLMNMHISGVREVTHGPHLHAVDGAAVGATAEAEAGAGAIAAQDPYLDLLGEVAVTVVRGDQGALATAGAPCDLPPHLQRSAALHLMLAGAQGVPVPVVR
jgi:hypothetical protein